MFSHEIIDILQALDKRVEELVSEILHLRQENEQLKEQLTEAQKNYEETSKIAEDNQRKRVELENQLTSLGSENSVVREKIQKIIQKIEEMEK